MSSLRNFVTGSESCGPSQGNAASRFASAVTQHDSRASQYAKHGVAPPRVSASVDMATTMREFYAPAEQAAVVPAQEKARPQVPLVHARPVRVPAQQQQHSATALQSEFLQRRLFEQAWQQPAPSVATATSASTVSSSAHKQSLVPMPAVPMQMPMPMPHMSLMPQQYRQQQQQQQQQQLQSNTLRTLSRPRRKQETPQQETPQRETQKQETLQRETQKLETQQQETPQRESENLHVSQETLDALNSIQDERIRQSQFVRFVNDLGDGRSEVRGNELLQGPHAHPPDLVQQQQSAEEWSQEFRRFQQQPSDELAEKWAAEFSRQMNLNDERPNVLQQEPVSTAEESTSKVFEEWGEAFAQDMSQVDWAEYAKQLREARARDVYQRPEYVFGPEQQKTQQDVDGVFQQGLHELRDGCLLEATRCFEAVVQRQSDNAAAWRFLGQCHAENENRMQCIAAFARAAELDAYDSEAQFMLAVQYTNRNDEFAALQHLRAWVAHHPDLHKHASRVNEAPDADATVGVLEQIIASDPRCARDADLHSAVGVLHHLAGQFPEAIAAFQNAVRLRPDDASMWNRLGATLANASQSHRAVAAYQKALTLKPNFLRALVNLGLSFANQGMHQEALQTYLSALRRNSTAEHVWAWVRQSLDCIERQDLMPLTFNHDLDALRQHFDF